ncbi:MAG: hypothetical protein UV60_C0005G0005 [Parcubacteria group bacterium GW2011_GWA2_43_11]|nr:MAG: hypothetical protein UU89_C0004G0004 [Parcubacteria group bacterium GW2011_GWC2_42_11]KKS85815.1 MAG: hypothetical protein UV60_C0005G0005 [Parcubacteria group bacterium GW2011_GWA2_43_11]
MIQRQKFRTKQARKRERVRLAIKATSILFGISFFLGLIAYGSHTEHLRYKDIHVQTESSPLREELASVITTELQGSYYGIWPKDSVFLVPQDYVEEVLETKFPRIDHAQIKRTGLYTLSVSVEERIPVALWCGDVVPPIAHAQRVDTGEQDSSDVWGTCYLVDKKGYIYARAPLFSGNVFPRYYGSLSHGEPIAQQYIPEEEFIVWQQFYTSLEDTNGSVPQALLFVDERDIELYLSSGLRVLIPRKESPETITRRLTALFESEHIQDVTKVEYIDLRFGTKAFVKYLSTE